LVGEKEEIGACRIKRRTQPKTGSNCGDVPDNHRKKILREEARKMSSRLNVRRVTRKTLAIRKKSQLCNDKEMEEKEQRGRTNKKDQKKKAGRNAGTVLSAATLSLLR